MFAAPRPAVSAFVCARARARREAVVAAGEALQQDAIRLLEGAMQAGRRRHAAGQRAFAHRIDTPATPAPAANSSACRGVIAPDGNGRPRVRFISASQRASNTCGRMQRAVRHTLAQRSRASAPLALAATPAPASLSPVSRASSVARVCARSRLVQRVGRRGRAERARCRPRHAGGVYAFPAAQRVPGARRGHHEHAAHARASPQQQRRGQPRRSPVAVRATNSLVAHCGCAATACARGAEGARLRLNFDNCL